MRLNSLFQDAGQVELSLVTGGEAILERIGDNLPVHGIVEDHEKVQCELEKTLEAGSDQLVTWGELLPNQTNGFEGFYSDSRRKDCVYKASFTVNGNSFLPITARIFTPHYIIYRLRSTRQTKSLLDFFCSYFSEDVLYENYRPLIVMFIYRAIPLKKPDPLPRFYCNNNSLFFLQEIGLSQYADQMYRFSYTDMERILYHMCTLQRNEMFRLCGFSTRDRAHFVGICEEYAMQIGRPIDVIY